PVTGFTVEDVTVMNGIKGTLNGSGSVYTINITPLTQGTVNINIASGVVTDAAGNNNTAASELIRIYDSIKPTVAIHSATNSITNLSVIPVTITFSEPVTGFTVEDVIVTNGIKGTLSGSGSVYMINITPSAQGTVTVGISADAAYDLANNGNTEALALTRIYDSINPTVAISSVTGNSTNVTPIPVTITFSEDVTGFTVNEITVINGVAGGFVSVSGSVYTAFITPAGNGEVIIDVLADTALDAALNPNNAAPSLTRVFDSERPTVIISSSISDYTYCSPITVTFAFSKNVTGFTLSDIIVNNGIASNLTAISNSTYTVDITSATQGNVTVDLPDGTAEDAAGNTNTAAVQFAYIYDNLAPVIATESVISVNATGTEFIRFSWDSANDNISSDSDLLYRAYYSMRDDISSIIDLLNNGTAINAWSSETSVMVSDLTSSTRYYFNVLVKDEAGNISLYNSISGTTDETITDEDIQLPNNTLITVNGEKKEAANIKRETTKGKTTITITIDDKLLKNLLDEKDEDVKVTLPAIGYTNEVVGQLNGQTIKNMERKNAVLEIKTDKASYSLPADQLNIDEISKVLDSQSNLEDIKVKINISEPDDDTVRIINDSANKDKLQLVVKPVEFTITCEANGKSMEISKFKGYVERRIAIPDGIDPAKISTAVVLNDDGTMSHVPTVIVQEGNKYYAVIKSLTNSIYTIVYKKAEIKDAEDHWAKTELNDMASRLVIQLDDEGRFFPDKKITRAQFAKLTVKALGLVPDSYKGIFSDVSDESEHSLYIEKAYEYGIIKGYGNGLFGPDDFLTREQATTIIERAMNLAGYNVVIEKVEIDMILDKFIDKSEISHYAVNSMAICIKNNIIIGRLNNEADPTADLTRAEAVVMLRRMLQNTGLINK
ncbi:MAG TPA: Ig-like domain-containing protein, partial [Clostridia bacterium]|nr:Ig-like domain-containing protein [Clostridia bacterium]